MPHDKNGELLKEGDKVTIECVVKSVSPQPDYCNLTVETCEVMHPGNDKTCVTLNAKQVVKCVAALVVLALFGIMLGRATAADPVGHSWVSTVHNPLGELPTPRIPAAPGVAAPVPFAQACQCVDQCSCNPLDNCGCNPAFATTQPTTAQRAAGLNSFKPAPDQYPAPIYTVAGQTVRYGITSGYQTFGTGFASGGCSSGGCANGQCGSAQTTGRRGFGIFR